MKPNDVLTLSFTSGTTGEPKAAMQTHNNYVAALQAFLNASAECIENGTHLSYLPYAHTFERMIIL